MSRSAVRNRKSETVRIVKISALIRARLLRFICATLMLDEMAVNIVIITWIIYFIMTIGQIIITLLWKNVIEIAKFSTWQMFRTIVDLEPKKQPKRYLFSLLLIGSIRLCKVCAGVWRGEGGRAVKFHFHSKLLRRRRGELEFFHIFQWFFQNFPNFWRFSRIKTPHHSIERGEEKCLREKKVEESVEKKKGGEKVGEKLVGEKDDKKKVKYVKCFEWGGCWWERREDKHS